MELFDFEEAVEDARRPLPRSSNPKVHLLLGNGFSIALKPDIFSYDSLFSQADFTGCEKVKEIFDHLGTKDFEAAVNALERAADIVPHYLKAGSKTPEKMRRDAARIKQILIETIAGKHPSRPYEITSEQYSHCAGFLKPFLDASGKIYTLNYDILLYWTLMSASEGELGEDLQVTFDDGFRSDPDDPDTDYVIWDNGESHTQNVYYLHGGLHLFDAGHELRKYTWKRTNDPLVEQARRAIEEGFFPLFVSEGSAQKKLTKIEHSGYLHKALRSLSTATGSLFTFGVSFSENDEHVIKTIERGKFKRVYIGLFGAPGSRPNRAIRARGDKMKRKRPDLEVSYYDSSTAQVWG